MGHSRGSRVQNKVFRNTASATEHGLFCATACNSEVYRHSRAQAPGRGSEEAFAGHSRGSRVQNKVFRNTASAIEHDDVIRRCGRAGAYDGHLEAVGGLIPGLIRLGTITSYHFDNIIKG